MMYIIPFPWSKNNIIVIRNTLAEARVWTPLGLVAPALPAALFVRAAGTRGGGAECRLLGAGGEFPRRRRREPCERGVVAGCAAGPETHDAEGGQGEGRGYISAVGGVIVRCCSQLPTLPLQLSKVFKLRSAITQCFREHYFNRGYVEVWAGCSAALVVCC